jgi:hypothetical protein
VILTAYETVPSQGFDLTAGPRARDWMGTTHNHSAYKCLPLTMANQAGWCIGAPASVRARWDGSPLLKAVEIQRFQPLIETPPPDYWFPASHFGQGIITWTLPYLFATSPGYNLLIRGPANWPKDGISPLEGLVETDWTPATFTVNWKITRTDTWIDFAKGEPIAMIVPQRRGELEDFTPQIVPISANPALQRANLEWQHSRAEFNEKFKTDPTGWEKDYFKGSHQNRLSLVEFNRVD